VLIGGIVRFEIRGDTVNVNERVQAKISEPKLECKSLRKAERFQGLCHRGRRDDAAHAVIEKPPAVC
jgi:hypothetical protein